MANIDTYSVYIVDSMSRYRKGGERMGQAYFNTLAERRPEIADLVRDSRLDPFYSDEPLGEFLNFVMVRW